MAWRGTTIRSSSIPWWALSGRSTSITIGRLFAPVSKITFMGKLSGISMGCDCCYTNHADADQNLNENLMILLATAGCNYIMGMPLGDDIMLNYQTTAFHDTATVRQLAESTAVAGVRTLAGNHGHYGKRSSDPTGGRSVTVLLMTRG
ncbi:ethanolamine ammonia-lyase heavy subunit [Klebsiella michiganensis]|uniref:Ethanolamine ammonia-lyase heavy subunit n=1 Tax=Klebsiella michiganensis TaxID=1134687 RepID=A0A7H4PNQ7_9ENTR|nr:ethanolamine ammonia-lyase heavy subunit [Klebsiella michiganensis]